MKYIRFFGIIAVILFITPFLGIPQSVKDFMSIIIACLLGVFAWARVQAIRHKKELIGNHKKEDHIHFHESMELQK